MFGIGSTELIVILIIALLVLGPKRLPELARSLGRGLAEFRRATSDITEEIDNARIMVKEEVRSAARSAEETEGNQETEEKPQARKGSVDNADDEDSDA